MGNDKVTTAYPFIKPFSCIRAKRSTLFGGPGDHHWELMVTPPTAADRDFLTRPASHERGVRQGYIDLTDFALRRHCPVPFPESAVLPESRLAYPGRLLAARNGSLQISRRLV